MTYSGGATTSASPSTSNRRARASAHACNGSRPLRYTSALKPVSRVNDVEVPAVFARHFHRDHLRRWTIELCRRKYLGQSGNVLPIQRHDHVHIMRQARFAINDDGNAPADHVGHAQRVQPPREHQKEVSLGHTGKSRERPARWPRRSNPGVSRATQPPSVAGRNDTAVRPPSISAPATSLAPLVALRSSPRQPIVAALLPRASRRGGETPGCRPRISPFQQEETRQRFAEKLFHSVDMRFLTSPACTRWATCRRALGAASSFLPAS